ncbi:MAG: hypothetical protein KF709_09755 [Gemmatimonadaceae bacterium]|nr:hypothetical protein [Gemmatimonadaceae bacterium]
MVNRITNTYERGPPRAPVDTYAVIETCNEYVPVYGWMAARVITQLQRLWTPRWITFRDIAGTVYTVRSKDIRVVRTSSPKTRAMVRAFYKALDEEREKDSPWE